MTDTPNALTAFRGEFPRQPLNARRVAGALEAPGCQRRTVLDAAAVNLDKLGSLVSGAPRDRQSPFALTRGNQFEKQVTDNGMADIISLARKHLHLEIPEVRQRDLSAAAVREAYPGVAPAKMNELRARLTRQCTEEMLTEPTHAYNLIRHAMTRLDFGGEPVYLEQDVLAFAVSGRLHVVEIKSYPRIDGRADAVEASATVRQTAVYVLSLQELVVEIGAPPDVVDTTTMIVLPENLSFRPTAVTRDIDMYVRRLRRQLSIVPQADEVIAALPPGTALPVHPGDDAPADEIEAAARAAREALAPLTPRFGDGCVSCRCSATAEPRPSSTARQRVSARPSPEPAATSRTSPRRSTSRTVVATRLAPPRSPSRRPSHAAPPQPASQPVDSHEQPPRPPCAARSR